MFPAADTQPLVLVRRRRGALPWLSWETPRLAGDVASSAPPAAGYLAAAVVASNPPQVLQGSPLASLEAKDGAAADPGTVGDLLGRQVA